MQKQPAGPTAARRNKMAIITSYFIGETYGLLGPQAAATIIERETPFDCIVVTVANGDDIRFNRHGSIVAWWDDIAY